MTPRLDQLDERAECGRYGVADQVRASPTPSGDDLLYPGQPAQLQVQRARAGGLMDGFPVQIGAVVRPPSRHRLRRIGGVRSRGWRCASSSARPRAGLWSFMGYNGSRDSPRRAITRVRSAASGTGQLELRVASRPSLGRAEGLATEPSGRPSGQPEAASLCEHHSRADEERFVTTVQPKAGWCHTP